MEGDRLVFQTWSKDVYQEENREQFQYFDFKKGGILLAGTCLKTLLHTLFLSYPG